jgi:hypothetical protein
MTNNKTELVTVEDLDLEGLVSDVNLSGKLSKFIEKEMYFFRKTDAQMKNTSLSAMWLNLRKQAKSGTLDKAAIEQMFGKERTREIIQDLKSSKRSNNVLTLLEIELMKQQAVSVLNMPPAATSHPAAAAMYYLKVFGLNRLNTMKQETWNDFMKAKTKEDKIAAIRRMFMYALLVGGAEYSGELGLDFILNRYSSPSDRAMDVLLKMFGISRFYAWYARENGFWQTAAKYFSPPGLDPFESTARDIANKFDPQNVRQARTELKDWNIWRKILPWTGQAYYWWFGGGRVKSEMRRARIDKFYNEIRKLDIKRSLGTMTDEEAVRYQQMNNVRSTFNEYWKQMKTAEDWPTKKRYYEEMGQLIDNMSTRE